MERSEIIWWVNRRRYVAAGDASRLDPSAPAVPAGADDPDPRLEPGGKVIEHPQLGTLRLHHAQPVPTGQPELRMAVYAPADAATRAALTAL
ncbi:MAG TPA: hypothetical protein VGF93_03105 [Solirubrobacteraceae bacterium]|jgi:hypothetical protein